MALSHFSSTKATSLASGMTSVATAVYLADGSTYPDPAVPGNGQYSVILGYGSDREEVCTVIAKPGTNQLTVTRGQDGTAAVSKNIGDVVVHGVSARDFKSMVTTDGATMTGYLTLSGAPTQDLHAATKKYVDDRDAAVTAAYTAAIANAVPAGMIAPFGSSSAMPGWLLCNGQSTAGYPLLVAMYGANVPDLRDKFVLGDGGSQPNTGGAATVALATANMPSHSHSSPTGTTSQNHTHGLPFSIGFGGVMSGSGDGYHINTLSSDRNVGFQSADHTHTIAAEGGGAPHENMPPYYALTFQVRAG